MKTLLNKHYGSHLVFRAMVHSISLVLLVSCSMGRGSKANKILVGQVPSTGDLSSGSTATTSSWENYLSGVGYCGSDTAGSKLSTISTGVYASASCHERLVAGHYRIKAREGRYGGTALMGFNAHLTLFKRFVPAQFKGVVTPSSNLPAGTILFDSTLQKDSWQEIILSQEGTLISRAIASFQYKNGGGGSAVLDLQVFNGSSRNPLKLPQIVKNFWEQADTA